MCVERGVEEALCIIGLHSHGLIVNYSQFYVNFFVIVAVKVITKFISLVMELADSILVHNRDWDPSYLSSIFEGDFFDFSDLWINDMDDKELMDSVNEVERYCPIVEDISLDDDQLYSAVETIEAE